LYLSISLKITSSAYPKIVSLAFSSITDLAFYSFGAILAEVLPGFLSLKESPSSGYTILAETISKIISKSSITSVEID
jgi:ubiquinone/menaquinone biosynthesis C-methylase UbiE